MLKKKWLALLLIFIFAGITLTGCSTTELNYYNLAEELSSQKVYSDSGSITLNFAQLPASMFNDTNAPSAEVIRKALDQHRIEYNGQVDMNQDACQYDFYIIDEITSVKSPIFTIIYRQNEAYIKVGDFVRYVEQFCNESDKKDIDQVFSDAEWVSITNEDLKNFNPDQPVNISNLLQKSSRQQAIIFRLYDGLFDDAYANYSPNLISQNGNQYILTLRGSQILDLTKSVSTYTIKNIETVGAVLKTFINSLSPTELADLGLNNEMQVKAAESVDLMVSEVMFNRAQYLSELQKIDESSQQELLNIINDSEIVSTMEKTDASTYNMSVRLHLNITDSSSNEKFNIVITNNYMLKAGGAIQITVPSEKIITLTELDKRMPQ
jgi:hypothetical protein